MAGPTSLLETRDVVKTFSGVRAVDRVSVSIPRGSVFGLIGPNGAGKTTLVNVVTGWFAPDEGRVELDGRPVTGWPPHRLAAAGMARTYQNLRLFEGASVVENVLVGRHRAFAGGLRNLVLSGRERRAQTEVAMGLLEGMGLAGVARSDVADLSYGMRRRVEIARALAAEPRLLLLDEPTAGMTRAESEDVARLLGEISESGVTVLLVEHNVRLVSAVCDRVAVLEWGAVIAEGTPKEVWSDERVRTAYLGEGKVAS